MQKQLATLIALLSVLLGTNPFVYAGEAKAHPLTSDQALEKLMAGNQRFVAMKLNRPNQSTQRLKELTKGQQPFTAILSCSDSRVPPEIIFDQGLGDLFVVRVAGNTADAIAVGSLEYSTEILGAPLIVVLGHEKCGAVDATVSKAKVPGHIREVIAAIEPAVHNMQCETPDRLECGVEANVKRVVEQLRSSQPILAKRIQEGKLNILGGRYDLDTGAVEIMK